MHLSRLLFLSGFCKFDESINDTKLARPLYVVQKLSQVKSIVIRGVAFGVVCWCDRAHLVSIHGVVIEKTLYLLGDLASGHVAPRNAKLLVPKQWRQ